MTYQVFHKLWILYFLEMANSLLSQSLNCLLPVFLVIDQEVLQGVNFVEQDIDGSILLLGISNIGLGVIGSAPLLMKIGLDLEVPGLGYEGGRNFPFYSSSSLTQSRLPFYI